MSQELVPVILCADDFGLSPGVSSGILTLLEDRRLSATSCMVNFHEDEHFAELRTLTDVDIGLHFTMTNCRPLSQSALQLFGEWFPGPGVMFREALCNRISPHVIQAELEAQYSVLCKRIGREPDFLDGHHHVHQYPGVAQNVVEFCVSKRKHGHNLYVRTTRDSLSSIIRRGADIVKSYAQSIPGYGMARRLERNYIATNTSFSGAYDLSIQSNYAALFSQMLRHHRSNGIIMCHPGNVDSWLEKRDNITLPRQRELDYFRSEQFINDTSEARIKIVPFQNTSEGS